MRHKRAVPIFLCFVLIAAAPIVGACWVHYELQRRLEMKIEGKFIPMPFAPVFYLKDSHFEWNGKVRFESGDLKIQYNPFFLLAGGGIHVRLEGKNLQVRLLGDWAKMQGVEQAAIENLEADFSLGKKGLSEVYFVDVRSRAFQFKLKKSDNK